MSFVDLQIAWKSLKHRPKIQTYDLTSMLPANLASDSHVLKKHLQGLLLTASDSESDEIDVSYVYTILTWQGPWKTWLKSHLAMTIPMLVWTAFRRTLERLFPRLITTIKFEPQVSQNSRWFQDFADGMPLITHQPGFFFSGGDMKSMPYANHGAGIFTYMGDFLRASHVGYRCTYILRWGSVKQQILCKHYPLLRVHTTMEHHHF